MVEPGLVLELRNGDAIIFSLGGISPFNLKYKGKRASIVMHTDCSLIVIGTGLRTRCGSRVGVAWVRVRVT